ncbi:MAG: deoxyribose-phosphate aldolase [Bacteroidales bacterium]|jgi:deoxyribose-phosphate aldolase|nr:deoxyribose-phosphate aldolase [Bacteroidales bacterium]NLM93119.1 deoxyribose-phosphate aldolase [Bacteroidales bacterium]
MIDFTQSPVFSDDDIKNRVSKILNNSLDTYSLKKAYASILGMIDLTTLEGADTTQKVVQMCEKGRSFDRLGYGLPNVAAVCVYPTLIRTARKALEGTRILVASVAGAFPAGQSPLHIKVAEVKYAVEEGADEIDMVISRGKFLEGEYSLVYDEIAAIREACGDAHLKVILETGELTTATNIRRASEIALQAGAHFLKTSTGKMQPAATPEAMLVMLEAIRDHYEQTGKMVGIKPAGGIADPETALKYYVLTDQILGSEWLNKDWLRFGASRLANSLVDAVKASG